MPTPEEATTVRAIRAGVRIDPAIATACSLATWCRCIRGVLRRAGRLVASPVLRQDGGTWGMCCAGAFVQGLGPAHGRRRARTIGRAAHLRGGRRRGRSTRGPSCYRRRRSRVACTAPACHWRGVARRRMPRAPKSMKPVRRRSRGQLSSSCWAACRRSTQRPGMRSLLSFTDDGDAARPGRRPHPPPRASWRTRSRCLSARGSQKAPQEGGRGNAQRPIDPGFPRLPKSLQDAGTWCAFRRHAPRRLAVLTVPTAHGGPTGLRQPVRLTCPVTRE